MPIQVVGPDGQQLEFPDGTDRETMRAAMQKRYGSGSQAQQQPAEQPGYWDKRTKEIQDFGNGIRYNIADTSLGLGQMVASGLDAIAPREQTTADLISGQDNSRRGEIDAQVRKFRADRERQAAQGGEFFKGGDYVGTGIQTLVPAGKLAQGGRLAGYGMAGLTGGLYGASKSTLDDESRLLNVGVGALSNMGGVGLAQLLGAAGRVAPRAVRDVYEAAKARGINLTPAQLTDSEFLKRLAHMTDKLPFSGAGGRAMAQNEATNRAVADLIGEKADSVNQAVIGQAADRLGAQFDKVFSQGSKVDRKFLRDLVVIRNEAGDGMDDAAIRTASSFIDRLRRQAKGGQLSGRALQSLDQQVRRLQSGGGDREQVAGAIRDALHDNFERNAGAATSKAWKEARRQYATLKTIEPIVARNPEGPLPATQLLGALNASAKGRTRMARGEAGELGNLAVIGQRMRGPKTSGSPEGVQTAAVGAGLVGSVVPTIGFLGLGNVAGRALNSPTLARLMMGEGRRGLAALAPYARPFPLLLSRSAYADEPERP